MWHIGKLDVPSFYTTKTLRAITDKTEILMAGFIINTTFSVDQAVDVAFLEWLRKEYVPFVERSGICKSCLLTRVLLQGGEEEMTYSLQIRITDPQQTLIYDSLCHAALEKQLPEIFPNAVYYFKTVMKIIE